MKVRVLQVIPSFHQGGSERQAIQLTRLLKADGSYDVRIACLDGTGVLRDGANDVVGPDMPEFRLTSFYDVNFARQLHRFCGLLKNERIQVVQTHDFYTNIFGMAGSKLAGVPVRIAAKRETEMRTSAQAFVERRSFGPANVVAVNSRRVKNYLLDAGLDAGKLEVIYNGIEPHRFAFGPIDRTKLLSDFGISNRPDPRLITMVANVQDPVKNHEMLLRAASRVASRYPETALVIAGEGERLNALKNLAQDLGLSGRAVFLGRCQRIPELLSVSEVCVLTSRAEGFSNSILEYMAAGKPVVATDVGGASEAIIEDVTGYLVPSDDDAALAERLCQLLTDSARARAMGEEGRRRVVSEFSTEKQLCRTLSIYERELSRVGRREGINDQREK